jgi:hypothetical protein
LLRPARSSYLLILILLVSGGFRFLNLDWGIPSPELPHMPFHPDEPWGMGALAEANIDEWNFVLKEAHSEGTLLYYTLTLIAAIMKSLGIIEEMPCCFTTPFGEDYAAVLYAGRALNILVDLGAIFLVFLILRRIADVRAALVGALVLGIAPFEIIYSHYMRPHIVANFLLVAVVFFSLRIYENDERKSLILVGILSGLAAAVRYTTGIAVLIPGFMLLWKYVERGKQPRVEGSWLTLSKNLALLAVSTIAGLFLGDPPLFLRFETIRPRLEDQATFAATDQFAWSNLLDLSRPWEYLSYLIPQGAAPFLWLLFYGSFLYVLFCKRYYRYAVPLIGTALVYLFVMAKGYASPAFVRASLPLFPIFATLTGIAVSDAVARAAGRRYLTAGIWTFVVFVCASTALFDAAYLRAMDREGDPRVRINDYLETSYTGEVLRIGIREEQGLDYFLIKPTLALANDGVVVFIKEPGVLSGGMDLDYVVLSGFLSHERVARLVEDLVESGRFELERTFQGELSFLGVEFDIAKLPHDMQYPFPELYLLRPSGSSAAGSDDVEQPSMVIEAESFVRGNARVDREHYGQSIGVVVTPVDASATFVEYEIELPAAGRYQVELRVASAVSRPLYLHVNGEVIGESIAALATGGFLPDSQQWVYAGSFEVSDPRCTLRIGRDGGPIAHIDKLRLTVR